MHQSVTSSSNYTQHTVLLIRVLISKTALTITQKPDHVIIQYTISTLIMYQQRYAFK